MRHTGRAESRVRSHAQAHLPGASVTPPPLPLVCTGSCSSIFPDHLSFSLLPHLSPLFPRALFLQRTDWASLCPNLRLLDRVVTPQHKTFTKQKTHAHTHTSDRSLRNDIHTVSTILAFSPSINHIKLLYTITRKKKSMSLQTFFFFFFFLLPQNWHMEVLGLRVKLELQLLATATPQQWQIRATSVT